MNEGFVVAVLRPAGAAICRLHVRRRHLAALAILLAVVAGGLFGLHRHRLDVAAATLNRLQAERLDQQRKLDAMERQAQALQRENVASERSIERIERTLGARHTSHPATVHAALPAADAPLDQRLRSLAKASARTEVQTQRLARLVSRILSMRRLAALARARTLAAIPSLNPVGGGINAAFGWRTDPWPEFHKGLDLAADAGTPVHAAAAGTVVWAGWDGGYGIKIDLDHGNGYHTWYCHLSRAGVTPGQHVSKGETIAAAGSTGESTGPHLHYQVMRDGVAVDPTPYLHGVPANVLATLPADSAVH